MPKTDILKDIIAKKKERLLALKQALPEEELKARIEGLPLTRPFIKAIDKPRQISLIAEIKKASVSRGIIREQFNVREIAAIYEELDVQAISVLTEEDYFLGNISYIKEVKDMVSCPILRKDFIIEPYQVYESRFFGADAILLIADILTRDQILEFMEIASSLGMECLVEVHTEKELKKILNLKVGLIGINNRDLRTLEVDFKATEKLYPLIPKDKIVVVESGIKSYQDVLFCRILGVNALLIGEAFMQAEDIAKTVRQIMGW
ncbi:MAG: indole-3-glycerol phosphate synthase TrpC [Candidatus Omnitrophica bacterium]|nr:indole-3-glycerol phosphate synthase TrpC [Candidatus Omnitrophota bacterium]